MRKIFLALVVLLSSAFARAEPPAVEVRLVVQSGGSEFPTAAGKRVKLGPPVVPSPFVIAQATAKDAEVRLVLGRATAEAFEQATAKYQGQKLAIVVGGVVQSTPLIRDPIKGGTVSITLRSPREAVDLARALTTK